MRGSEVSRVEAHGLPIAFVRLWRCHFSCASSMKCAPSRKVVGSGAPAGAVLGNAWKTCEHCLQTRCQVAAEAIFGGAK
jgi:hypothetical protein